MHDSCLFTYKSSAFTDVSFNFIGKMHYELKAPPPVAFRITTKTLCSHDCYEDLQKEDNNGVKPVSVAEMGLEITKTVNNQLKLSA